MEKLWELYENLHQSGVKCFTWPLDENQAMIIELSGKYALFMDFDQIPNQAQETAIVAHEAGHIATGCTHRVSSPLDLICRHEYRANKWAIHRLIPKDELYSYYSRGYTQPWEIAEQMGLPEGFIRKAMAFYHEQELAEAE